MRNILIIVSHPSQDSFNYNLFKEVRWFCNRNKFQCDTIDLYREDFDPILREKESNINVRMIQNYQNMIKASDLIIFITPIWWSRCSSMLEGFFDKVLTEDFAFDSKSSIFLKPLLNTKKVIVFSSLSNNFILRSFFHKILFLLRLKFSVINPCFGSNNHIYTINFSKDNIATKIDHAILKIRKVI